MTKVAMLLLLAAISVGSAMLVGAIAFAFSVGVARTDAENSELGSCAAYPGIPAEDKETADMAFIPGGTFRMGSERHQPEERFTHVVRVDGLWIDRHEVTNAQFEKFIAATGYVTLAERGLEPKTHVLNKGER